MKTLISALILGALSTAGAFAGAVELSSNAAGNNNTTATPQFPFRPLNKRPSGARQAAATPPKVNVEAPKLPFRHYQKQPMATPQSKPSNIEATRQ